MFTDRSSTRSWYASLILCVVLNYCAQTRTIIQWAASVVQLGLTGWRIHHTKSTFGFYGMHDLVVNIRYEGN